MQRLKLSNFKGIAKLVDSKKKDYRYLDVLINGETHTGVVKPINTDMFVQDLPSGDYFYFRSDGTLVNPVLFNPDDKAWFAEFDGRVYVSFDDPNRLPEDEAGQPIGLPQPNESNWGLLFYDGTPHPIVGFGYLYHDPNLPIPHMSITESKHNPPVKTGYIAETEYEFAIQYVDLNNGTISTPRIIKHKTQNKVGNDEDYSIILEFRWPTSLNPQYYVMISKKYEVKTIGNRRYEDIWERLIFQDEGTQPAVSPYRNDGDAVFSGLSKLQTSEITVAITTYSSSTGKESAPLIVSRNVKFLENLYVVVDWAAGKPQELQQHPDADLLRFYITNDYHDEFILIEEVPITNNQYYRVKLYNTVYNDIKTILTSQYNKQPPKGLKYLTESNGVLFGAVDNTLYFSEVANPHAWGDGNNWIKFQNPITGIAKIPNGVLVFSEKETYAIYGNSPDTFVKKLLSSEIGCNNHNSIDYIGNTAIWYDKGLGICASSGSKIDLISYPVLGYMDDDAIFGVVHDRQYFLSLEKFVDIHYQRRILVYDYRTEPVFREIDDYFVCAQSFRGDLYWSKNGQLFKAFKGADKRTLRFETAEIACGTLTKEKEFHSVVLTYRGQPTDVAYQLSYPIEEWIVPTIPQTDQYNNIRHEEILIKEFDRVNQFWTNEGYFIKVKVVGNVEIYELDINYTIRGNKT